MTSPGVPEQPLRFGLRWIVEETSTWWSNYANYSATPTAEPDTDTALCLPTTLLIVRRLIDWPNHWSPD